MCLIESQLPISSSELISTIGITSGWSPSVCRARSANTMFTSPPFMS